MVTITTVPTTWDFLVYADLVKPGVPIKWLGANGWLIAATTTEGGHNLRVIEEGSKSPYLVYIEQVAEITWGDRIYRNRSQYDLQSIKRPDMPPLWKYDEALGAAFVFDQDLLITGPVNEKLLDRAINVLNQHDAVEVRTPGPATITWRGDKRDVIWRFQEDVSVTVQPQGGML